MYHAPPYKKNSPCEDQEFNKELNNEEVMERDAFLFTIHDIVLHYAKAFEERYCRAIPPNLNTFGQNTPIDFAFPPIRLKTNVKIATC